jgi:hypothetical protein
MGGRDWVCAYLFGRTRRSAQTGGSHLVQDDRLLTARPGRGLIRAVFASASTIATIFSGGTFA